MQNKTNQGQNVVSLKHGSEMSDFCLKQGLGLMASAAHLNPKFPQLPPPYLPPRIEITKEYSCVSIKHEVKETSNRILHSDIF